jgi:hypothetical protein
MNRDSLAEGLYRKPRLGITVMLVIGVWSIALPAMGSVLAWSIDAGNINDSFRAYVSHAWTRGVIFGGLSWFVWILAGVRPRGFAALMITALALLTGVLLSRFSDRELVYHLVNVTGIILASAAANFLIGLPAWSFGFDRSKKSLNVDSMLQRDSFAESRENQSRHRRQFSIFNLMLITLLVAILILMARQLSVPSESGEVFWGFSVVAWLGLATSASLIFQSGLRKGTIGPFLFAIAGIALSGLIVAAMCTAELIQGKALTTHGFPLLYGVLFGGHLMTATVFAAATCVQSMRDEA